MRQPGRFWLALAYELPKPETLPFIPEEAVTWCLAFALGVISVRGEESIPFLLPDESWKPKIDSVEARLKTCKKGGRAWRRRTKAARAMSRVMGASRSWTTAG